MSRVTWKLFGREARNGAMASLALVVTAILLVAVIILGPILIPLHFVLRKLGRNGFFFSKKICIEKESFQWRDSAS